MTDGRSVTSSVEVEVDPETAFLVFTEELSCWWQQGPINFYDSTRAFEQRMEPGVGGRLLEVYDDATGEELEIGRITSWQPGSLLAWTSWWTTCAPRSASRRAAPGRSSTSSPRSPTAASTAAGRPGYA